MLIRSLAVLGAVVMVAAPAAAPDRKPPRIVSAVMQDSDRDARADSVRLRYSARVRHARDRDGRYPFAVSGYRVASVGAAKGKVLVLALVEQQVPDTNARPAIRYKRTTSKPVTGSGKQAVAQLFRSTRPHGHIAPEEPAQPPAPPPAPLDSDKDGTLDAQDCAPQDAAIHPGAPDLPDLEFVDSNCDGIDGTEEDAIFASPKGDDANPGTKEKPKRQIQAAVQTATGKGKYVLAAAGSYTHVTAAAKVGVYGGYDPDDWARKANQVTSIVGVSEGLLADGAGDVTLQLLSIRGVTGSAIKGRPAFGMNAYGIRALNGSSLRLQRVTVTAGDGAPGAPGAHGARGRDGSPGLPGAKGACDNDVKAPGGAGGASAVGRDGGKGGDGKYESDGQDGAMGLFGTPGGEGGGKNGHFDGWSGRSGSSGGPGLSGAGGTDTAALASSTGWRGQDGSAAGKGGHGNGGGGGGAGRGQSGFDSINGTGNGGGGGGGGGEGGNGGGGGGAGGGSFGVWLHNSTLVAEKSSISAGSGGAGGRGGDGGEGGLGGPGGAGYRYCSDEAGTGGDGGRGGNGGRGGGGGGGAGGPSIGIYRFGGIQAALTLSDTTVTAGNPGPGGGGGTAAAGIRAAIYP
jgi:hypothetical protein